MTRDEILQAFDRMRVWQRGDQRAVHKPLLVLFALARVGAGGTATMDWNEAEPHLKELLEEFGQDGSGNSRHYPFWHLQTDGSWQLEGPQAILARPPSATPTLTELRENRVRGGMLAYHGASLILPQSREYLPQADFLEWHRKQVFKSPERPVC